MSKTTRHLSILGPAVGVIILAFALVVTFACRGSDQVAPDGAIIVLSPSPATIILVAGSGSSEIAAMVLSSVGVPLEDQDVRFTTSAGSLFTLAGDPGANIPIRTDHLGNAHVTLVTSRTTTVTARSGTATGSVTLDTVTGDLSSILLNQDTTSPGCMPDSTFLSCSDVLCLEAQAIDTDGAGISGLAITFVLENAQNTSGDSFAGVFNPTQVTTGIGGFARTRFQIGSSECINVCSGTESCDGELVAQTQGGAFPSGPVTFTTSIP